MPQGWRPTHPGDPTPKWGVGRTGLWSIAIAVVVGVVVALVVIGGRAAEAVDGASGAAESQEQTPPPWFGGRVEMPEHGFVVTVPDGSVAYDMTGDLASQLRVVAPGASEEEIVEWSRIMRERMRGQLVIAVAQSSCGFVVGPTIGADLASVAAEFFYRQSADGSVVHLEPPRVVELPAGAAHVVTYGRPDEEAAIYLGEERGLVFNIWCAGPERSDDDWHSIAETFEFLPAE